MDEEKVETVRSKYGIPRYYHGDTVRTLFIVSALIMVGSLPFINNRLPVSPLISILFIVIISLTAGFLAPRNKWAIRLNLIVSVTALIVFEYYAIETYKLYSYTDILFLSNQVLAVIFLFATYNSAKTFRSLYQ